MTTDHPRYRDVHGRLWEDRDGPVLRACTLPDCPATYDAIDGPPRDERWWRKASPSVVLCPDHTWLFDHHVPRLDHDTRACACDCGHPLPGPTLGHMGSAWVAHALTLLGPTEHPKEN